MKIIRNLLFTTVSILFIAMVAFLGSLPMFVERVSRDSFAPAWQLVSSTIVLVAIVLLALVFSKNRLATCAILSLYAFALCVAVWHTSYRTAAGITFCKDAQPIIGGVPFNGGSGITFEISLGGIGLRFARNVSPRDRGDAYVYHDYLYYRWGLNRNQPYPFTPTQIRDVKMIPRPIPRWGGFDSIWYFRVDPPRRAGLTTMVSCGIAVPIWTLLPPCALFPALWLRRRLRHRHRVKHSLCLTCGFDLRAHHPGDKCPECATPVPATSTIPLTGAQTDSPAQTPPP